MIHVPKIPELSANQLVKDAVNDSRIKRYLPDLKLEGGEIKKINRQFLFNLINTLDPSFFPVNIRKLLKERKDM